MAKEDNSLSNYIPINRKLFSHPFWEEERAYSRFEAWLDLVKSARFEMTEASSMIDGRLIKWNRGEIPASLRYLAERWKWSKTKVDNFIKLLENDKMIVKRTATGTNQTIIKLCNYEGYNKNGKIEGQQKGHSKDNERTGEGQPEGKTNKENNSNKEKKGEGDKSPILAPVILEKNTDEALFKNFQTWIDINAPRVGQMTEPFTFIQYMTLKEKGYDSFKIRELLTDMHNWKDLHKKRVSAYLTLLNWKRREDKQS